VHWVDRVRTTTMRQRASQTLLRRVTLARHLVHRLWALRVALHQLEVQWRGEEQDCQSGYRCKSFLHKVVATMYSQYWDAGLCASSS
jgi:hypothetical protein